MSAAILPRRARRGIALLLVLATLVLAATAAAGLARAATAARLSSESAAEAALADRLLHAAEPAILDWLHRHAGRIVLPPDAPSPRYTVLDDPLGLAGRECRLTITAFDQCGMASATVRFGPVDATLPPRVRDAVAVAGDVLAESPGLDLLAAMGQSRAFPSSHMVRELAPGEVLATHNPARGSATPTVNVNTAPVPLLAAVYGARGLGLDAILEARAAGRVASPGAMKAPTGGAPEGAPLPVSMSSAWAFRVDCEVGRVMRSWWCVYTDSGSNWERVQRLAIEE